jgi:hypothetical protein
MLFAKVLTFTVQESAPSIAAVKKFLETRTLAAANDGDTRMGYAAIALAILGGTVGVVFRMKVLLSMIALLLLVSIVFSIARGFGFLNTALTVMAAQTILQASYFLGLIIRSVFSAAHRMRPVL